MDLLLGGDLRYHINKYKKKRKEYFELQKLNYKQ